MISWILSFNWFNSSSSNAVSIKKIKIGGFAIFVLSLYSTVLFCLNNSAGKFSSDIKSAYAFGKLFLLRQNGHSHTLALVE